MVTKLISGGAGWARWLTLASLCGALVAAGGSCSKSNQAAEGQGEEPAGQADKAPAAADKQAADAALTPVTLQLNWVPEPEFGGFYAAAHGGLYRDAGLEVDIVAGGGGVPTWNMVATGKVPFAIASAGEIIKARLKDADVVAVYSVYQTSPQALMVHADSGVTSLEEVFTSGKIERVAMEAGLPYVRHLEKRYGFDKVEVVQYGGNLSLFLQDKSMAQQSFIFAEPVSAKLQEVPVEAFSIAESGFNPYLAVVITRAEYLAKHRDVVEAFVRASRAGWDAYLADPEPTNAYMITQKATMRPEAMTLAAELQKPYIVSEETKTHYLGYMSATRWQSLADELVALEDIERAPEVGALFENIAPQ